MATITLASFSALQHPLQRNLKSFTNILAPFPFHLTFCEQQILTQRLFKVSDISPHFLDIDPTFHVENRISNCISRYFFITQAQVQSIFFPRLIAFFLSLTGTDVACEILWGVPPPCFVKSIIKAIITAKF